MITFRLPFPPSLNRYYTIGRHGKRPSIIVSTEGRKWKFNAKSVLWSEIRKLTDVQLPLNGDLDVRVSIWFPSLNRRRDLDNRLKALLDVCTEAGVWNDDSQIKDLRVVFMGKHETGKVGMKVIPIERSLF